MIVALLLAATAMWGRSPVLRPPAPGGDAELEQLAVLISLGLRAGMAPVASIAAAAQFAHPVIAAECRAVVRTARLDGLAAALRARAGPVAQLWQLMARAVATGAPLAAILDDYAEQLTAAARLRAQVRARRLPVKLVFPLALLMLPGLVLMISGPALIDVFERIT